MKIAHIQVSVQHGARVDTKDFSDQYDTTAFDQFCTWLVESGFVSNIEYTRQFDVTSTVLKKLKGGE